MNYNVYIPQGKEFKPIPMKEIGPPSSSSQSP